MSPKCQNFVSLLFTCLKICLEHYKILDKFCDSFQGSLLAWASYLDCTISLPCPLGHQKSPKHPKDKKHKNKAASLCYTGKNHGKFECASTQLFLELYFDYETIKGQVPLEGVGGGSRHRLVDTHLKSKKGFSSKGSILGGLWGGGTA